MPSTTIHIHERLLLKIDKVAREKWQQEPFHYPGL